MSDLVAVIRPDGRTYQPCKPPRAVEVDNSEDRREEAPYSYIYVLGTHDVERAYRLASNWHGVDRETAKQTWARLAPRNGEFVWMHDPVRGAATVTFEVTG